MKHTSLLAALAALCASSALAQVTISWDNGGSAINNNWSTDANWTSTTGGRDNTRPISTAPYDNVRVGGGYTSNLESNYTVNSVELLNTGTHTVTAGGGTLSINSATKSGNPSVITNSYASTLTISAPVVFAPTGLTGNSNYRITAGNAAAVINISQLTVNDSGAGFTLGVQTVGAAGGNNGTVSIGELVTNRVFTAAAAVTNLGASANFTGVVDVGNGSAATLNLLGNIGANGTSTGMLGDGTRINLANGVTFQRNVVGRNGAYSSHIFGSAAGVTGSAEFSGAFANSNSNTTVQTAFKLSPTESGMTITYSGAFTAGSQTTNKKSVVKDGAGVAVLTGTIGTTAANYFQGGVAVNAGTLRLGNSERIYNDTALTLSGGTLDLNGYDETVATLKLDANSSILFAAGSELVFADSSGIAWAGAATLTINGWVVGNTLRFGNSAAALTSTQLGQIKFGTLGAQIDAGGFVTPVPEPSTMALLGGMAVFGLVLLRRRRA